MAQFHEVDTVAFDKDVERWFRTKAPEQVIRGVNEATKEVRRELVGASPVGPAPSASRARLRAKKGAAGKGYGPIRKGWRRRSTKSLLKPAQVINVVFYAPLVEFGTGPRYGGRGKRRYSGSMPARPFVGPVVQRAGRIVQRALDRVLSGRTR